MNSNLRDRLLAIQKTLMAQHAGGSAVGHVVAGQERENFLDNYLRDVLPPVFRFGSGAATDSTGQKTGQLDIVLEVPFGPNFPMPGGNQRLYLAESVAAVVEVKSDLSSQWQEVERTVELVKKLQRDLGQTQTLGLMSSPDPEIELSKTIPCYAVGYRGFKTTAKLKTRLDSSLKEKRPDGAIVIESGAFVGHLGAFCGPEGLYAFVAELAGHLNSTLDIAYPKLSRYL